MRWVMDNYKSDKYQEPKISLHKRILYKTKFILKNVIYYPFWMKKRYGARNAALFTILNKIKYPSENLRLELKRNVYLVNLFINLPFLGFFLYFSTLVYLKYTYIENYIEGLTSPLKKEGIFDLIQEVWNRSLLGIKYFPFDYQEVLILILTYLLSIIGARILSVNYFFEKEESFNRILLDYKMFGEDGVSPWRATWTSEAVLFDAYKHNPETFAKNASFWYSVGFRAGIPQIYEENPRIFLVPMKRSIPKIIILSMKGVNLNELEEKYGNGKKS